MDEKKSQDVKLSEKELADVAGGASGVSKAEKSNKKCIECMKGTNLTFANNNSYIYTAKRSSRSCCKEGHIYENGVYSHYSTLDMTKWFYEHR